MKKTDMLFSHVFRIHVMDTLNLQPIFFRQVMGPTSNKCAFSFFQPVMSPTCSNNCAFSFFQPVMG